MTSFVRMLRAMSTADDLPTSGYTKKAWVEFAPLAKDDLPADQLKIVKAIMEAILGHDASCQGLIETTVENEEAGAGGTSAFQLMMRRLYDTILVGDGPKLPPSRLRAFIGALREASESSPSSAERGAVHAFVRVLEAMAHTGGEYTRAEWIAYTPPPGSYTPTEQATFITTLSAILDSTEAVEGMLETMDGGDDVAE